MSIKVCLSSALRKLATGEKEVSASAGTVREILEGLSEHYPDLAPRLFKNDQLAPGLMIYVGDTDIRDLQGLDTKVEDGATLNLLTPIAGA